MNNFYDDEIMLVLAYRQAEDKQRWAAHRRLVKTMRGRRTLRRSLGLVLTSWGQNLLASSQEAWDEQTVAAA